MNETKKIMTIKYDGDGRPQWTENLSHEDNTQRASCIVPPNKVIPVVFIPGIMGSNLKLVNPVKGFKSETKIAWRPDSKWYTAVTFSNLGPEMRRKVLDPENTKLDDRGEIPHSFLTFFQDQTYEIKHNWFKEFGRRGWGTVMLSSYGDILYSLERNLNNFYDDRNEISSFWKRDINMFGLSTSRFEKLATSSKLEGEKPIHPWGDMKGHNPLQEDDLKNLGDDYWFPVYARGYNWLKSNEEAGTDIAKKIEEIIKHYQDLGYECEKVILVTHSMGGLAARAACHSAMGKIESLVAGVVHGEQPAIGAPAAYKRMHAGFEGGGLMSTVVKRALGGNGKEVTAVLANAQGGLELLPTKAYPPGWLSLRSHDNELMRLPLANPYQEIYNKKDEWWRLMNPEWIEPSTPSLSEEDLESTWGEYKSRLKLVEQFHDKLGSYYHPVTHAHYGADEDEKAWTTISWNYIKPVSTYNEHGEYVKAKPITESADAVKFAEFLNDDADGIIRIKTLSGESAYTLSEPDQPGDGTVPAVSGEASANPIPSEAQVKKAKEANKEPPIEPDYPIKPAEFSSRMSGYDHQGSYKHTAVKNITTYSVARIAIDESLGKHSA